jgi:hypothetical protein
MVSLTLIKGNNNTISAGNTIRALPYPMGWVTLNLGGTRVSTNFQPLKTDAWLMSSAKMALLRKVLGPLE